MTKGVWAAWAAAALFGLSTPLAKVFVGDVHPVLLAGLLYLGSGIGLALVQGVRVGALRTPTAPVPKGRRLALASAIFFGGVCGPVLLMTGLALATASSAALLLNLEAVFTALLAWLVMKENFSPRVVLGMVLVVLAGALLTVTGTGGVELSIGAACVAGACLCWGIDNTLMQAVSSADPVLLAGLKGLSSGTINVGLAVLMGVVHPPWSTVAAVLVFGFFGYGVSFVLFVLALRHLGSARTAAYFGLAPFVGAGAALLLLHEPLPPLVVAAAALMAVGVWLHLTERHDHLHTHDALTHSHTHVHAPDDVHHAHAHDATVDPRVPHTHEHTHAPLLHAHAHHPDIHHRHAH